MLATRVRFNSTDCTNPLFALIVALEAWVMEKRMFPGLSTKETTLAMPAMKTIRARAARMRRFVLHHLPVEGEGAFAMLLAKPSCMLTTVKYLNNRRCVAMMEPGMNIWAEHMPDKVNGWAIRCRLWKRSLEKKGDVNFNACVVYI